MDNDYYDLSERCPRHGSLLVSRCGTYDAPCAACEAELEEEYHKDCRADYKRIASAACVEFGLTPARFNELVAAVMAERPYYGLSHWVDAAQAVADTYRETASHDHHCNV